MPGVVTLHIAADKARDVLTAPGTLAPAAVGGLRLNAAKTAR